MTLSPVLHPATGTWTLGEIRDHKARPLTRDEIEAHIAEYESLKRLRVPGEELHSELDARVPSANCSCHLHPPCSDCVEWASARIALDDWSNAVKAVQTAELKSISTGASAPSSPSPA